MNTREHLEAYIETANHELQELKNISWPQNRNELNNRMSSLESFLQRTMQLMKRSKQ